MLEYSAQATIDAPAETIWSILTTAPDYPNWDPTIIRIEGTIAPGEKIKVYSKLSPDRAFPVTVITFEPGRQMQWSSGMPLGLFKGVRTFTLTPNNGRVDFHMNEVFSGILLPLIGRTIPDMSDTFQQFAQGLKQEAERVAQN